VRFTGRDTRLVAIKILAPEIINTDRRFDVVVPQRRSQTGPRGSDSRRIKKVSLEAERTGQDYSSLVGKSISIIRLRIESQIAVGTKPLARRTLRVRHARSAG
jgi:hypothetical protein